MKKEELKQFMIMKDESIVEAMKKIDVNTKGILFVVNDKEQLLGVVTDGDIRRWLIKTGDLFGKVSDIMNINPKSVFLRDSKKANELMEFYCITAIPVITVKRIITDVIFIDYNGLEDNTDKDRNLKDITVVIMAGGKGTRLYPYTKILPKPLIPIGDIPIMERIINSFMDYGVENFIATVNYKKEMIKSYFSDEHLECSLNYIEEDKPLGTAGSLRLIDAHFKHPFFLSNCDILIRADYYDIYKHHIDMKNDITIVTALKNIVIPYGVIYSSENGRIDSMEEKPQLSYFVNTGMYILNEDVLEEIPNDTMFHMTDLTDALLKKGRKVGMYPISEDSFLDMGEMEEMRRMEQKLNID